MVKSGHSVGKTFLAAWIVNWFYDSHPASITISTAPTKRDVCDLLWKEIPFISVEDREKIRGRNAAKLWGFEAP